MAASAYETGDSLVKLAATSVNPGSSSDDIDQLPGEAVSADDNVLNHTVFFDEDIDSGAQRLGYDDVDLDDSIGMKHFQSRWQQKTLWTNCPDAGLR